ncbi:MAG: hypothetical protein PF503_23675 [Desulfobacula sp.]|nr:hypothetical protein [Desulfobacula sp.]
MLKLADKETWNVFGIWFSGIATLSVVFIAIWLQAWTEWRKKPKLKIVYDPEDRNDNIFVLLDNYEKQIDESGHPDPHAEELWLRVNVLNNSRASARDVELRFINSYKDGSDIREDHRPSWWFKVSNLNKFSVTIPPRYKQPFDIAYLKNVVDAEDDIRSFLAIVPPDLSDDWQATKNLMEMSRKNKLSIGARYRLVFAVVSSNADAAYYEISYTVSERLSDDIPRRNLQGRDVLRRRLNISGPNKIAAP